MGNGIKLSTSEARRLCLQSQLIGIEPDLPAGKEGAIQVLDQLGYVQIDSIAVVQRAHHHTFWNRHPDYSTEMLHELLSIDRRIFEYWGHAASYLPVSDFRFYLPRKRSHRRPRNKWERDRFEQHGHLMAPVLERIRVEGPLGSRDFKPPPGATRGTWWDWKPAKIALEMLFDRGELMITERRNFQRIFDLTERVLPDQVDARYPDDEELGQFLVRRALSAHGVAQEKAIVRHIHGADRRVITDSLAVLVDTGEVVEVAIESDTTATYYALADTIDQSSRQRTPAQRMLFLSPFDNLIIQRERTRRLFAFDYTLECYLPAAKRRYGYFVLPILWKDAIIGRMDAKADRKPKTLRVQSLHFEAAFDGFEKALSALADALGRFMRFNECIRIALGTVTPAAVTTRLQQCIDAAGLETHQEVHECE